MYSRSKSSYDRGLASTIDWTIVLCYLALVIIGWLSIYASVHSSEPSSIFDLSCRSGKQFVWICVSLVANLLVLFVINPKFWEILAPAAYLLVLGLLVLVIFVSKDVKGSHSWFELGPIKFQPAEISKITTSLMLALVMSRQGFKLGSAKSYWCVALVLGLPMLAIIGESETGSALVYLGFIFVLYREGLPGWWLLCGAMAVVLFVLTLVASWWISAIVLFAVCLFALLLWLRSTKRVAKIRRVRGFRNIALAALAGTIMIVATGFLFDRVLQDHQRKRIEVLLGMKEDPNGVGYNVRQSMIAIGSGGFSGKGFLNGTQTTYGFVPEQSTDFIFCTIGEEWGFIGSVFLIFIFVLLIFRIIHDADECRESFARIYGYGLAACLSMHLFINIGMTVGLVPVIGIPLPMVSYGGSSLLAFSLMLFIFLALYRQEKKYF